MGDTFVSFNENPDGVHVGDCTVRAISTILGFDWECTFVGLCVEGFIIRDMPSANRVWGAFLRRHGFRRHEIPDDGSCLTVEDFCLSHPHGVYLLALDHHVVAIRDGDWYDTWDSGNEEPIYYWGKKRGTEKQ